MQRVPRRQYKPAKLPEPRRESKVCSVCREDKPLSDFYARPTGGPAAECKSCAKRRAVERQRQKRRAAGAREVTLQPDNLPEGMRYCTACKQVLALDCFQILKRGNYRAICSACKRQQSATYKAGNKSKVDAGNAAYREARKAELTERQRAWREAHPERYSEIHSRWKKANPDAMRASANKRRVLIEQQDAHYTTAEWRALKQACGNRCLMCGKPEPEVHLTNDHIIPVKLGGKNTIENLQPLCGGRKGKRSCNSAKHKAIVDYRPLRVRRAFGYSTRSFFSDETDDYLRLPLTQAALI